MDQEPEIQKTPHAEAKPSAFSVSDEEIDHVLRRGSGFAGGRLRIAALYDSHPSPKAAQDFLKEEYGIGGHSHTYLDGSSGFVDYNGQGLRLTRRGFQEEMRLRWPVVEQHIRKLVENGDYLDEAEKLQLDDMRSALAGQELPVPAPRFAYHPEPPAEEEETFEPAEVPETEDLLDDIDSEQIREQLARNGIVNGEVVDLEALARNPFIQQVEADVAAIAEEEAPEGQTASAEPEIPPLQPGEQRIPEHDGIPAMREITIDLTLEEAPPVSRHPQRPPTEPPFAYDLHPGDTIYMDNRPFSVDEVRFFDVMIVTGGGLTADNKWRESKKKFFLPIRVLSSKFRGKFLSLLKEKMPDTDKTVLEACYTHKWVVYCKPPFASAEKVISYLGRYTHRVAISNNRMMAMQDGKVTFRWRDYADGNRMKNMTVTADEFIRRFLLHILPAGFRKIRHYGIFAFRNKSARMALCRRLTHTPKPAPTLPLLDRLRRILGHDFNLCPCCKRGFLSRDSPYSLKFVPVAL